MAAEKDFIIEQGKTFAHVLRWEAPPYIYKAISGISQGAPAIVTSVAHGVPDGWRVAIVSVKGMKEINATVAPPAAAAFRRATRIGADSIELNDVNSSEYTAYVSGGFVQYLTPVDLTGFTARMKIKSKEGVVLASTEAGDTPLDVITVAIDTALKTITVTISASATAAFSWTKGLYDLEMVSPGGVVTAILKGKIQVTKEITT